MQSALDHLRDALEEVQTAATNAPADNVQGQDWSSSLEDGVQHSLEDSIGELLFAVVALARRLRVNPEDSLRRRSTAFAEHFRALEAQARADGVFDVSTLATLRAALAARDRVRATEAAIERVPIARVAAAN